MHKLTRIPVLIALGIGLALAGCGGDDDDSGQAAAPPPPPAQTQATEESAGGGGATLELTADEGGAMKYDKTSLSADAGTVEISMANPSQLPHNVAIDGGGADEKGEVVQQGGTSTVSVDLKAGTYKFYCSVGSHRNAGMEGTLTVK